IYVVFDRLGLLGGVLLLELPFFLLRAFQGVVLVLPDEHRAGDHDDDQDEEEERGPRQDGPVGYLANLEKADVVERHTSFAPLGLAGAAGAAAGGAGVPEGVGRAAWGFASSGGGASCLILALSVNSLIRRSLAVGEGTSLISTSSGCVSDGEASMLRMSVETRALDCA